MKKLTDPLEPGAAGGEKADGKRLVLLGFTALGIVYGDIGTSPLYALRQCFLGRHGVPVSTDNVLGVLSLIFWSLLLIISVKYLVFIFRADNQREGGILALTALVHPRSGRGSRARRIAVALGIFGAALLYGDGTITPAISVLGAVEGLEVITPALESSVVPITVVILVGLFLFQRRGTAGVGAIFGPVMLVWFSALAALGIAGLQHDPGVLRALLPHHAIRFFVQNGLPGFVVLAAVFLVVTGGEALYADMGQFGRRPIRLAWFALVLPSLLLNYFGQGALLLEDPDAIRSPFYLLAPGWVLYPLVLLATVATVIASQAVISGAFSLTRQAIQLGYAPRMRVRHTSGEEIGQVYIPAVNWILMVITIGLVIAFQRATNLAGAYGIAVSTTMVLTTVLAWVVARELWGWSRIATAAVVTAFLVPDLAFLGANLTKLEGGGWFPILLGIVAFTLMTTWSKGRRLIREHLSGERTPVEKFLGSLHDDPPARVPGTAVFVTGSDVGTPSALRHQIQFNHVAHERVVLLTVRVENTPRVPARERLETKDLGNGFWRVVARYGFLQMPRIPTTLKLCEELGLELNPDEALYFLGREVAIASDEKGMSKWRAALFSLLSRNSMRASTFFNIPHDRVIEIGVEVEL